MATKPTIEEERFKEFLAGYIEAALWSTTDSNEKPLDDNYGPENLHEATLYVVERDCRKFFDTPGVWDAVENGCLKHGREHSDWEQAGHDFWLTRNGHGVGFWETDDWSDDYIPEGQIPEGQTGDVVFSASKLLDMLAKKAGEVWWYPGDPEGEDNEVFIYQSGDEPYRPTWRCIVTDISQHIRADVLATCGGVVYEVNLFCEQVRVHCAELTASAELWFLGFDPTHDLSFWPEDDEGREKIHTAIDDLNAEAELGSYMHYGPAMEASFPLTDVFEKSRGDEVWTDEMLKQDREDTMEFLNGNAGAEHIVAHWLKLRKAATEPDTENPNAEATQDEWRRNDG